MPRVVHFELPADDPQRATAFYRDVFGWSAQRWEGPQEYWLINTGPEGEPGINGGLARRSDVAPGTVNTIGVPSLDEYVSRVERSGGRVVLPKMAVPGVGWLAYCTDTESNTFGMMQPDPSAA